MKRLLLSCRSFSGRDTAPKMPAMHELVSESDQQLTPSPKCYKLIIFTTHSDLKKCTYASTIILQYYNHISTNLVHPFLWYISQVISKNVPHI